MYTKITYSNDRDEDYWYFELTTKTEEDFEKIENFLLKELSYYGIESVGCPTEDEDGFYDTFAINKEEETKGELMKEFRGAIKKFKKNNQII